MGLFDGLGLGLAQAGAGVTRGALAGQQQQLALMRAQQQMAMMNAWHMGQLQTRRDLAGQRIDEQQRQAAGREADSIQKMLQDPAQQVNFNRFPGLQKAMMDDYVTRRNVQSGQLDWRQAPPSRFTNPLTGEALPLPGAEQTPGQGPWQPEPGQAGSENPYLTEKGAVSRAGLENRQATQQDSQRVHDEVIQHLKNTDIISGTHENAALIHQQFGEWLDQAKLLLSTGRATFQEQEGMWAKLLDASIQEKRAGGNVDDALKPLLLNRGQFGQSSLNTPAVRDYLTRKGYTPAEIDNVIQGGGSTGGTAQFNNPSGPAGGAPPTGKQMSNIPGASGLTPGEQAAIDGGTSGLQPDARVAGSFQKTGGPPILPAAPNTPVNPMQVGLPGGGPPTGAQVASAGGGGGLGVAPVNPQAQGAGPAGVPLAPRAGGLPQPPPVKNPYVPGTFEASVWDAYTGVGGKRAVDAKFIMAEAARRDPQGAEKLADRASSVIGHANTMQANGRFTGLPVQDPMGARIPNPSDYSSMEVNIPGVAKLPAPTTSPVTLQGGFQGSFTPPSGSIGAPGAGAAPPTDKASDSLIMSLNNMPPVLGPPVPPGGPVPEGASPTPPPPAPSGGASPPPAGGLINPMGPGGLFSPGSGSMMSPTGPGGVMGPVGGGSATNVPVVGNGPSVKVPPLAPAGAKPAAPNPAATRGSTTPSQNVFGGGTTGAGAANVPVKGQGPTVSSASSPTVRATVMGELKKFRSLPYSAPVEKFFKDRGITDPDQQQSLYRWTTASLLPAIRQQHPELGEKGARAQIYGQLDKAVPRSPR